MNVSKHGKAPTARKIGETTYAGNAKAGSTAKAPKAKGPNYSAHSKPLKGSR